MQTVEDVRVAQDLCAKPADDVDLWLPPRRGNFSPSQRPGNAGKYRGLGHSP